ncbi:AmmeMemoRadiSam system protein A [Amphritea sp. 1_MG-2023]|uniref:AmmeMemoRadiSam system protein A n=1 Tax=Amphritea sp. 1_MG-2023 TaxID=3062670 RepID=UPI0026E33342|nr:AmmeMemoRadiSam system protein A [Amphritea sp. 1_MG-2023]MDO6564218.1 AmmeMemoRadiSam system protein A [Amphritea sp. 1_MG-2023]
MPSIEQYSQADQRYLLQLARQAIAQGIIGHQPVPPSMAAVSTALQQPRGCFVTLTLDGQLRGCIGNLEADTTLLEAVWRNSYLAAFKDQRFMPVTAAELDRLNYEISILTPLTPLSVKNEAALLERLRPGIDGLVLTDGGHRATFLPSVWQQLPQPERFVSQLRLKAGLPADYWRDSLRCDIYQAIKITEESAVADES